MANSHESQLVSLRAELKEWERAFAAKNGGKKAGRDDIKRDAEIAAKYKIYSRLREKVASSSAESGHDESPLSKKRKIQVGDDRYAFETPRKNLKYNSTTLTPSKQTHEQRHNHVHEQLHPSQLDPYDSPSHVRTFLTPSHHSRNQQPTSVSPRPLRNAIGPTPQRDGKPLGLFDLLSASGRSKSTVSPGSATATPSHRKRKLLDAETPSKRRAVAVVKENDKSGQGNTEDHESPFTPSAQRSGAGVVRTRRYSMTPASSAKKFYLSRFFASPSVGRFATIPEGEREQDAAENKNCNTPNKSHSTLETPAFLRRKSLFSSRGAHRGTAAGTGRLVDTQKGNSEISPAAVRMPPRVMGKGLSALVQGLRDMENKRMDDDMDVLREIEEEELQQNPREDDNVLVRDSQLPTNGEAGAEKSPSKSQKSPKKRGQKRTTRLVTMRPSRALPKPQPQWGDIPEEEEEEEAEGKEREREEESEDELASAPVTPSKRGVRPARKTSNNTAGGDQENTEFDDDEDDTVKGKSYEDDDIDDEDFSPDEPESIVDAISKSRKRGYDAVKKSLAKASKKMKPHADDDKSDAETKKTKTKKVNPNAQAHANYRTLKIRSRGASGAAKGKFGGRFRRR